MEQSSSVDEKRVFIVGCKDSEASSKLGRIIENKIGRSNIFLAKSTSDVEFKLQNTPPHVLILDLNLPDQGAKRLVSELLNKKIAQSLAFIIISEIPDEEFLVDEIVTGKLQFLRDFSDEGEVVRVVGKALNFVSTGEHKQYNTKFVSQGEVLIREGEAPDYVYILKKGTMLAYKGKAGEEVPLGKILAGEFVGEMAHFNHENRSASVKAVDDCELIEIPDETLDRVLFTKPSWAKALFLTLSKRVKQSNDRVT